MPKQQIARLRRLGLREA